MWQISWFSNIPWSRFRHCLTNTLRLIHSQRNSQAITFLYYLDSTVMGKYLKWNHVEYLLWDTMVLQFTPLILISNGKGNIFHTCSLLLRKSGSTSRAIPSHIVNYTTCVPLLLLGISKVNYATIEIKIKGTPFECIPFLLSYKRRTTDYICSWYSSFQKMNSSWFIIPSSHSE